MGLFDWFKGKKNERLVSMLRELAQDATPQRRGAFYRELASCRLLIATPGLAATGLPLGQEVVSTEETKVRFLCNKLPDGRPVMLAFTDEQALLAWREAGCDTIEMALPALAALALGSSVEGVAVNIRGPVGGLLTRPELEALAKGETPAI